MYMVQSPFKCLVRFNKWNDILIVAHHLEVYICIAELFETYLLTGEKSLNSLFYIYILSINGYVFIFI
jgi:hypothetical protein